MDNLRLILIVSATIMAFLALFCGWYFTPRRMRHRRNVRKSKKLLRMFRSWDGAQVGPRILGYLRKIDPLVFEELVLTALADIGAKIERNCRYTGDGGIDGRFFLHGSKWLVQAKRYSSAINPQHVGPKVA